MATIYERTLASGERRFRAEVRIKGHPRRVRVFQRKTDAKVWAQQVEAEIRRGGAIRAAREESRTLGDLLELYRREVLGERLERYRHQREAHLNFWERHLDPSTPLLRLQRSAILDGIRKLRAGAALGGKPISVGTANRYLASLRAALSFGLREEWLEKNPAAGLQEREPRGRMRLLEKDELERLLEASIGFSTLHLLIVLAVSTGARQSELLRLRWDDIDFERRQAVVHDSKNSDRRVLPLHGHGFELLQARNERRIPTSPYVFAGRKGARKTPRFPRRSWEKVLRKAEIEDFRFHDLRHTFASYLAMKGATLPELAEVLGHRTLQMVKRYAHLTEAHTHDIVRRMTDGLFDSPTPT